MLNPLEQINNIVNANKTAPTQPAQEALRKAAMQFEAILLQQLTSSLNTTNEDSEDSLFGSDGGTGLAKQMFSEQLATTMSQSGGVGLSDLIMRQFGVADTKTASIKNTVLSKVNNTVKEIKQNTNPTKNVAPLINKSAKIEPIINNTVDSNEAEIISTFEDDIKKDGIDENLKPLILDGKIVNSTRPRIIPNVAVKSVSKTTPTNDTIITNVAPTTEIINSNVAPTTNTVSTTPTSTKVSYQMPANGRISSDFGTRFHPIDKKMKFHGGLDIAVPVGTKVVAAADGIVKFAGWKGGYGNVVIIQHADGSESLYGHNSKLLVTEGQKVTGGEQISLSGSTGKSTGPHLHFEIRQNGQLVNPSNFLSNVLSKPAER